MLTIACPACHQKLAVKEDPLGKKVKCPGCGQGTAVPAGEEHTVPPAPRPQPDQPTQATVGDLASVPLGQRQGGDVGVGAGAAEVYDGRRGGVTGPATKPKPPNQTLRTGHALDGQPR